MTYYPLHVHSTYSTLDSIIKIKELVKYIKELGLLGSAITEHGNLSSVIDFYKECRDNDIHPIIGMEAYVTEDLDNAPEKNRDNYHLVLLARDEEGLKNLTWLSSNSYLSNFYYKPRIYRGHLEERGKGLIGLSACLAGYPARMLRWESSVNKVFLDDYKEYVSTLKWFSEVFYGEYYLEIQEHDFWEQKEYNRVLIDVARKEKFPLVITSDAHYLRKEDRSLHELLMAMQFKKTLEDYRASDQMKYGGTNYIRSDQEMKEIASKYNIEDAIDNTISIAKKCQVKIEFGQWKMPTFAIEEADDYEEFRNWCNK